MRIFSKEYNYPSRLSFKKYSVSERRQTQLPENKSVETLVLNKLTDPQEDNKAFIEKVLSAIQSDTEKNYSIVSLSTPPSWRELTTNFPNMKLLLSFGFYPHELQLQTHNQLNQWIYIGHKHLIFSNRIEELLPDASLKMRLWNQLKEYTPS